MAFDKRGIAPPDPNTNVGKFRLLAGDSEYQEYVPPEPGYGLYQIWTDAEIQAFLILANDNVARAIALAYAQIGASWASTGATIRTDDLTYSVKESVGNWMALAAFWNKIADDEEERAANDYFDLVDTRGGDCQPCSPELAWPAVCRCGGLPGCVRCSIW